MPRHVWLCARCCNGASRGSRSASGWRCLRAGLLNAGAVYQRVQRRALVVVQRRNAAGGCGGLAPCAGESLRGGYPSHVAGPEKRFLFRIIQFYTKRSARTDQGQTLAGAPVQAGGQFRRSAFCIKSNYTVGAPAATSRRIGPRVIKSARAGNAVAVAPATLCRIHGRSASPAECCHWRRGPSAARCAPWSVVGCALFLAAAGDCRGRWPAQAQALLRTREQNRDWTWARARAIANLTIFGQVRSFHWHHSRIWRLSGETSLEYSLCSPGSSGKPAAITKFAIALFEGPFGIDFPADVGPIGGRPDCPDGGGFMGSG